ncbi:hypothetical protein BDR07DRAFT_1498170 [Suillus spraguei]|nr:hypothetical protein BDR07DRAFT_1498170 [Suillus spraguei]
MAHLVSGDTQYLCSRFSQGPDEHYQIFSCTLNREVSSLALSTKLFDIEEVKYEERSGGARNTQHPDLLNKVCQPSLDFPLIEMGDHDTLKGKITSNPGPVSGELHILPTLEADKAALQSQPIPAMIALPLFAQPVTPNIPASSSEKENLGDIKELLPDGSVLQVFRHHEAEAHHHHHEAGSFLRCVHCAIMALGLWKGLHAAVFVLVNAYFVLLKFL